MLLLPAKCNLAGGLTGLAYRIVPSPNCPGVPVVAWEPEEVAMTPEEAFRITRPPAPTRREEAAAWLEGVLSGGPLLCEEVERRARDAGFSLRTLGRAKRELGVETSHRGFGTPWAWSLPGACSAPVPAHQETSEPKATETPSAQAG